MSNNNSTGASTTDKSEDLSHQSSIFSLARAVWLRATSLFTSSFQSSESPSVRSRGSSQPQQQAYAGASNSAVAFSPSSQTNNRSSMMATSAYVSSSGYPGMAVNNSTSTAINAAQTLVSNSLFSNTNAAFNAANALELMRTYHVYVRTRKTRWRSIVVFLIALLFFSCCTSRGSQGQGSESSNVVYGGGGNGVGSGGNNVVGVGLGPGGAGVTGGLAGSGATGSGSMEREGERDYFAGTTEAPQRHFQPPWLLRVLLGYSAAPSRMDMEDVQWWPPSNRTTETSDPNSERGLNVGTPNAASLSVSRSQPPWSADTRDGFLAFLSRAIGHVLSAVYTPERPSYEQALSAFFRTRQAMTEGSCNRCQARMIEHYVRAERHQYREFLRENKLRVPLLLYYNRLPVYAMLQHFRLMRVRNYQLLDYVSRADAVLRRPETVSYDVSSNAALHARELDFELTRLSFVFYLQRLHMRALRHADAMRLETFHFLRHLSSTVPTLRQIWTGQDHCNWPGVSCVVVQVPLNLLIDDYHPTVQAFVNDLFSVCRGPDCRQRRCVPPGCGAYTQHLTRRLFTSAAPAYWMKWDRMDDTAAMDEMIFPHAASRKNIGVDTVSAAQQQQQTTLRQQQNAATTGGAPSTPTGSRRTSATANANAMKAEKETAGPSMSAAYVSARASRMETSSSRTVWTEQQFGYEHPDLLLADPLLLIDVDVSAIMEEIVRPSTPIAHAARVVAGEHVDPVQTYRENVERPLVEDLLPMQEKLLHTIAEAAPRGLRFGKQGPNSPSLTIPFTFVMLNLQYMGLRGYLPDFYDTRSKYDVSEAGASAASTRSSGIKRGSGNHNRDGEDNGSEAYDGDVDKSTPQCSASGPSTACCAGCGGRTHDVRIQEPRSDVYWGRLSRQRMLENRNLTTARARRSVATVQAIATEVQRVLRRVEKVGLRNHHEDLAAYFSEVSTLAQFQNERWSPYRWPEAMIAVTNAVSWSASRSLYPILEDNAFSTAFTTPVYNVDHHVEVFGELNPRLIALLTIDVSGNPLLSHVFPRTWLSIPFLQSVRTQGSSILAQPLRIRGRVYNQSFYCPPGSSTNEESPYAEDARRSHKRVLEDAARDKMMIFSTTATSERGGGKVPHASMHDRDYISSLLLPPYLKVDSAFPDNAVDAFFQQKDPLTVQRHLYQNLHDALDGGFVHMLRQYLALRRGH